jgi:hypothetical protein
VALATVPDTFAPETFDKLPASPLKVNAVTLPVTLALDVTTKKFAVTFAESSITTTFEPTENPSTLLNV